MPSCSSSSNIQGTSTVLNPTGSDSRITMKLLNDSTEGYTLASDIFAGAVIRYDPTDLTYHLSKADNNANAEVVGVVETKDATTGDITVVMRGLINYPSGATLNSYTSGGVVGGSGGNDIWFLSAATAGQLQNIEPEEITNIAKPILQAVATSENYNYQVLNYIGYAIGGEIAVDEFSGSRLPVGSTMIVPEEASVPTGWVDASEEREIEVSKYPEYYAYYGKKSGYVEKITVATSTSVTSSLVRKGSIQKTSGNITNSGRVLRVNTADNQVFVRKSPSTTETDITKDLFLNNVQYDPTAASVHSIFTPKITSNQSFNFYENGVLVQKNFKVIHKIQDQSGVTIPKKVTVTELDVTSKLTASDGTNSYTNVATELADIFSRLQTIENRIGIS